MKDSIKPLLLSLLLVSLPVGAAIVTLDITFDEFPAETYFGIWEDSDGTFLGDLADGTFDIFEGVPYDVAASSPIGFGDGFVLDGDFDGETPGPWQFVWDLDPGTYVFVIFDAFGDGICCEFGEGSFSLTVDGDEVFGGGAFSEFAAANFVVDSVTPVPVPAALLLFGSAVAGWIGFGRRKVA